MPSDEEIEDAIDYGTNSQSEEKAPAPAIPWITGLEAFSRYGKNAIELRILAKSKKVRTKRINNKELYSVDDLESLPESGESQQETSMADLVRAARDMLAVAQKHQEIMFDKYMGSFDKLLHTAGDSIDKQNGHIMELERQALEMREATEKVFNLEHERKLSELREHRTEAMQGKALEMLQKTIAPWVMQRLGGQVPGVQQTGDAADPRLAQLGQAVVGMVGTMTDEQFAALAKLIGEDEYNVLKMIRDSMKGTS